MDVRWLRQSTSAAADVNAMDDASVASGRITDGDAPDFPEELLRVYRRVRSVIVMSLSRSFPTALRKRRNSEKDTVKSAIAPPVVPITE